MINTDFNILTQKYKVKSEMLYLSNCKTWLIYQWLIALISAKQTMRSLLRFELRNTLMWLLKPEEFITFFPGVSSPEGIRETDQNKHYIWNIQWLFMRANNIHRNLKNNNNYYIKLAMKKVEKLNISTDVQPRFAYYFSFFTSCRHLTHIRTSYEKTLIRLINSRSWDSCSIKRYDLFSQEWSSVTPARHE